MLKQEYAQHIAEMSQRVRCEEWAELEKNKEDFFETGNTWALSWLGHLTVLDRQCIIIQEKRNGWNG